MADKQEEIRKLTEEECMEIGGHYYEAQGYILDPPTSVYICKHCGKEQHEREQPLIRWE